jgi:hypothetical protein
MQPTNSRLRAAFSFQENPMTQIYAMPVPEHRRVECSARRFGAAFSFSVEPLVYVWAGRLAPDYDGGYWEFYCLCNGGFYMAPAADREFEVVAPNGFVGRLSSDALGIAACLYAFSHASFSAETALAEACAVHYHQLRDYALQHSQADQLLRLTD